MRQRSHFLVAGGHGLALSRMVHSVLWITPASFSFHRCSLRVVVDLLWGSLKLELWRLYPDCLIYCILLKTVRHRYNSFCIKVRSVFFRLQSGLSESWP